jgi:hypothetical protein
VFHDDEGKIIDLFERMNRSDVVVLELRRRFRLAPEPAQALWIVP